MKLIIILICLALERYTLISKQLMRFQWFEKYLELLRQWVPAESAWAGWVGVALIVVPPAVITALVIWIMGFGFFGILAFVLEAFVLFYCLGPVDLYQELQTYFIALDDQDEKVPASIRAELIGGKVPKDIAEANRAVTEAIFTQANERLFGVLFWYVILGPAGAVIYRLGCLLQKNAERAGSPVESLLAVTQQLRQLLDWFPIRLTTLTYSLMGDFKTSFKVWLEYAKQGLASSYSLLRACSLSALGINQEDSACATVEENREAMGIIDRATVIILVVIAVFTLGTWIS